MNVSPRVPVLLTMLLVSGLVSACALRSGNGQRPGRAVVVLLPDPEDGHVGRIAVSNPKGSTELSSARASTRVTMTQAPRIRTLRESDVNRLFGEILGTLPPPPRHFTLPFRFDSEELTEEGKRLVPDVLQAVKSYPVPEVAVIGHTDTTGNAAGNYELGHETRKRDAHAADEAGSSESAIDVTSHGEADLLVHDGGRVSDPATDASKSRFDDPAHSAATRPASSCCAACCPRSSSPRSRLPSSVFLGTSSTDVYDRLVRSTPPRPPAAASSSSTSTNAASPPIGQWPWRRDVIARLVARLRDLGASIVALDIIFAEPDRYEGNGASPGRTRSRTRSRGGRVVLGYALTFDGPALVTHLRAASRSVSPSSAAATSSSTIRSFMRPAPSAACRLLAQAAGASGFLNAAPDPDGRLRRVPLLRRIDDRVYPGSGARRGDGRTGRRTSACASPT